MSNRCPSIFRPWARKQWKEKVMTVVLNGITVNYTRNPMNPDAKPVYIPPENVPDRMKDWTKTTGAIYNGTGPEPVARPPTAEELKHRPEAQMSVEEFYKQKEDK